MVPKFSKIIWGNGLTVTRDPDDYSVIRVDSSGGGLPSFALTGSQWFIDDSPIVLDASAGGDMDFSTTGSDTFAMSSGGRAHLLAPGMYVIGCQMHMQTISTITGGARYTNLQLEYSDGIGYSIEVPWLVSGFVGPASGGEQIMGTRFTYEDGAPSSYDVALQRLHPVSLTSAASFPVEIQPTFISNVFSPGLLKVRWLAVWGWRIGDNLDALHSN